MDELQLIVFGWSHENATIEIRAKLSLDSTQIRAFISESNSNPEILEIGIVSTCNRTEFYITSNSNQHILDWINECYLQIKNIQIDKNCPPYIFYNNYTVKHLLSVASGMKSMMLGENQILTQIKSAYKIITTSNQKASILSQLFRDAIRAGKAVRTHTKLCKGAVSVSFAVAELSRKIFLDMSKQKILIVGAGETSELVAKHFKDIGALNITIANRSKNRRVALAEKINATSVSLDKVQHILSNMDIIVTATHAPDYLIHYNTIKSVIQLRKYQPILLIDISTPRNIEPEIQKIDGVFLFSIDNLKNVIADNLEKRRKELEPAEKLVDEIMYEFMVWFKGLKVTPTIAKLIQYYERIRIQELDKYKFKLEEKNLKYLDELSKGLIRKLLHYPIHHLKEMSNGQDLDSSVIDTVWKLYKLDNIQNEKESNE